MENPNPETNRQQSNDVWQAEVLGQIYDTDFAEMTEWIAVGSLVPTDKVRRGNLRWIEARKVPMLVPFFNAKDNGTEPPTIHTSVTNSVETPAENFAATENFIPDQNQANQNLPQPEPTFQTPQIQNPIHTSQTIDENLCVLHPEYEAKFSCETCANNFCGQCPKSYGGTVKICPMCGAMCKKIGEVDKKREKDFQYNRAISEGFGISDVAKAFAHPFKFTTSFFFGGLMFMLFTLGQSAGALGGIFMMFAALFCFLLANMLAFGILANTIENFSQGKLETNFMPNFDAFNLWDDVVHPFFLSVGVYISSFGPFILAAFIGFYLIFSSMTAQMQKAQTENANAENVQTSSPYLVDEKKAAEQSEEVRKLIESVKQKAAEKRDLTEKGLVESENNVQQTENLTPTQSDVKQTSEINQLIQDNQKQKLESVVGKTEETRQAEKQQMLAGFLKQSIPLIIFMLAALVWGIFYFPAACAVAGYTRSFWATINPSVGINTIKTFGADYLKIFGVYILLLLAAVVVGTIVNVILSPFAIPGMGNLPATAILSWFTFYLTIVFSCVLGYALFKNSDKFKFYRG